MQAQRLSPSDDDLARAVAILRAGGLLAFPTETVYGLGADARSDKAVARIFAAKERPRFNPLIVHVPDIDAARALVRLEGDALRLAEAFWPGPLTLVAPLAPDAGISPLVTAGHATLALRVPGSDLARAFLARARVPVAAPSANPSGRVSPTTADHVLEGLGDRIDAVLDGGPSAVGVESTIVATGPAGVRLLRPGGLPAEAIEAALGRHLDPSRGDAHAPEAPGQLASHYAPMGTVRLNAYAAREGETFLGFGPVAAEMNLSRAGDLTEAAANLFGALRELDRRGARAIAVSPIPETGLGRAINDRLRRAAAPRT
ncbi:translation factor SUA5 [Palleronia aestuarii]|uniref:Threonylcarbamoyl-AMP synthase n=1 Tax=Palleronia aestuarii TaxID=568105 RepID=A0A2W7P2B3_9RHOB|nr:L-threonylcarbamoyladenylate synthase [Palleronia aestuarii]PZX19566.1 translation factor SUA5 [Palleronia aestuarii]